MEVDDWPAIYNRSESRLEILTLDTVFSPVLVGLEGFPSAQGKDVFVLVVIRAFDDLACVRLDGIELASNWGMTSVRSHIPRPFLLSRRVVIERRHARQS